MKAPSKDSPDFFLEVIKMPFIAEELRKRSQSRIGGMNWVDLGFQSELLSPAVIFLFRAQSCRHVATVFLVSGSWVHLLHNTFLLFFCSKPKRE